MNLARLAIVAVLLFVPIRVEAAESGVGGVAALMKLLDSGRVPAERRGLVVEMICSRGNGHDLGFVFNQLIAGKFDADLERRVLQLLTDAAVTRKQRPEGDLSGIVKLVDPAKSSPDVQLAAMRLAALWKVTAIVDPLIAAVTDAQASAGLRSAALDGLAAIGDDKAKQTLAKVATGADGAEFRGRAAAALAKIDLDAAAQVAAGALGSAKPSDDVAPLLDAFLTRKGGPDKLAVAVSKANLTADVAKLALRYMYSVGRSDAALSDVLSKAAGISADPKPPTPDELKQIIAEVAEKGDAARGEKIFRRGDLSCLKCHAISRAGGNVGPDLSAVGSISPVDYVANSILDPNLAIKEQYVTRVIVTDDGQTFTGIVIDRDNNRVNLKDASGKTVTIPTADIDEEAEGRSLMPQGLTKFLTRQELVDLIRFISELGKPGTYAIRKTPTIQRWRVLKNPANTTADKLPQAPAAAWTPAYGMTAGALPVGELGSPGDVVYLQGEIEVFTAGEVTIRVEAPPKTQLWIDEQPGDVVLPTSTKLSLGRHKITLRVQANEEPNQAVTVTVDKPSGAKTQFEVVGGI